MVISSHLKRPEFNMRVLIISAFLACAAAAPSGIIQPLFYQHIAIPAAVPTISPGDIQAAAIDAQVKANDHARAAADRAQDIADQAVSNVNEKVVTDVTLADEKNVEAFWSNEEKRWQALDALKTAEAQIDGAAASNAEAYAKSALAGGAVQYVAGISHVAPVVAAPIPPAVYTPYLAAVKSVSTQAFEVKAEENKDDKEAVEVKTAEPAQPAEAEKAEKIETPAEKSAEKSAENETKPLVFASPVIAPFAHLYRYNVAVPAVGHFVAQPVVNYATSYQQVHGVLAPTLVKHAW